MRATKRLVTLLESLEDRGGGLRLLDGREELLHLREPSVDAVRELALEFAAAKGVECLGAGRGVLRERGGGGCLTRYGLLRCVGRGV